MLTTEVIYDFFPGEGWKPRLSEERILGKTADGYPIWIINRKPEVGELYLCLHVEDYADRNIGTHDSANIESFAEWIEDVKYFDNISRRESPVHNKRYVYVVIEPA